jgi:hypothetical protein
MKAAYWFSVLGLDWAGFRDLFLSLLSIFSHGCAVGLRRPTPDHDPNQPSSLAFFYPTRKIMHSLVQLRLFMSVLFITAFAHFLKSSAI